MKKLKLANIQLEKNRCDAEYKRFELSANVIENFFNVLLYKEQLLVISNQVAITDSILEFTNKMYNAGKIMKNDLEETKLQLLKEKQSLLEIENTYNQSAINLKGLLQLENRFEIFYESTYKIEDSIFTDYKVFEKLAVSNNPYLNAMKTQIAYLETNKKIISKQNLPRLDLDYYIYNTYASSGYSIYKNEFANYLEDTYSGYLEFNLVIPIFNGREYKNARIKNENEIQKSRNTIETEYHNLISNLETIYSDAINSTKQVEIAKMELESIRSILQNRIQLYAMGKNDIFSVLSYKKQLNELENSFLIKQHETFFKYELLRLYCLGKI